jgi:(2S)-methylsuccinyl-CoA dehydrogenase
VSMSELLGWTAEAVAAVEGLYVKARAQVRSRVFENGKLSAALINREQHAAHGLAWLATYCTALESLSAYCGDLARENRLGELESLLIQAAFGEYLNHIAGGIPMNQAEFARPSSMGLSEDDLAPLRRNGSGRLMRDGMSETVRTRIAALLRQRRGASTFGDCGLDETLDRMREEMRRFADSRVAPHAHAWHRGNSYVPLDLIAELAGLGVFALTLPESYGGLGLGKIAMCVVSEELSRGWIAVGSIGTRAEIACELILTGGTAEQKQKWLPKIASGEIIPAAVFTEPGAGSDLASMAARAARTVDGYSITGNKTWITHPVRADMLTILARTDSAEPGHRGLSMFLAEKPRGSDDAPFPAAGMSGGEIEVLGYRGMKEYEIRFDNYMVPHSALLGNVEGQGFRQLMQTFESARIQTAARAIGVAQNALELGLAYAEDRVQFGEPIIAFPRIADKLVIMAVEIMAARQLTYHAARRKDEGRRCDLEAGMAKLFGARMAWAAADNSLQIHGGNGFALEFPISRVLCDARILNIFEGAAEIQAQIIARRLLEDAPDA